HSESAAVQLVESGGKKQAEHLNQAALRSAAAVQQTGRDQSALVQQRAAQVAQQLLAVQMPDPAGVDEVLAAEHSHVANTATAAHAQIDVAHGHVTNGLARATAEVI